MLYSVPFFFLGKYIYEQKKQIVPEFTQKPTFNHTYQSDAIQDYIQKRKEDNKFILYSKYHKCILSKHQLITQEILQKQESERKEKQVLISKQETVGIVKPIDSKDAILSNKKQQNILVAKTNEQVSDKQSVTAQLFSNVFKNYAKQLIKGKTCETVELISGPIFSKDTPYKQNKQVVKNVFTSTLRKAPNGEMITDRYFTFVICNKSGQHYWNGFSHRRPNHQNYRLLNYITARKKIQEQTGLVFNLKGKQLTQIDYSGIAKERLFQSLNQDKAKVVSVLPETKS